MNKNLEEFAEKVPAKGCALHYLSKAVELMKLYGEVSSIMEDEETEENYAKVEMLVREIEEIVK